MDTKKIFGLVFIGIAILILLFNGSFRDTIDLNILLTEIEPPKCMALLVAMVWGVVIGALVK